MATVLDVLPEGVEAERRAYWCALKTFGDQFRRQTIRRNLRDGCPPPVWRESGFDPEGEAS